jgi:hypothetical protein
LPRTEDAGPGAYHPGLNTREYHAEVYRGLQEVHPQTFTNIQLMREKMPQKLVDFGSTGAVAVLPDKLTEEMLDAVRAYVSAHVLWDAVGFAGRLPYTFGAGEPDLNYFAGRLRDTMPAQTVR